MANRDTGNNTQTRRQSRDTGNIGHVKKTGGNQDMSTLDTRHEDNIRYTRHRTQQYVVQYTETTGNIGIHQEWPTGHWQHRIHTHDED